MRVLIVDDEKTARDRLRALLAELDVEVAGEAADGLIALERIRELRPDVVLLDIAMPEADGFEVARHLTDPKPLVIFQTAFSDHALRAFEHEAVDYVVKPVTAARLRDAIERAGRRLERRRADVTPALLAQLESILTAQQPVRRTRVLVRHAAGHRALLLRDVIRFVADEGLVYAVSVSGRFLTDYTLGELESRLAGTFVRASRADLVHLDRIDRVESNGDGSATLTLTDRTIVHVSRRRAAGLRRSLS